MFECYFVYGVLVFVNEQPVHFIFLNYEKLEKSIGDSGEISLGDYFQKVLFITTTSENVNTYNAQK